MDDVSKNHLQSDKERVNSSQPEAADAEYAGVPADFGDIFLDFFENSPLPMCIVDASGTVLHVNKAELSLLGYKKADYLGRSLAAVYGDETLLAAILSEGCTDRQEKVIKTRDAEGKSKDLLITANGHFQNNKLTYIRVIARDITQKRREELLREMQFEATMLLVGADSIYEGLLQVTQKLTGWLDYDIGLVWKADEKSNRLKRVVMALNGERETHDYLLTRSVSIPLAIGAGFPSTSWFSGKCEKLSLNRSAVIFSEQDSRISRLYRETVVIPIATGKQNWGLIALFSKDKGPVEEEILPILSSVGLQIGQFVDRIETNEAYLKAQERYYVAITASNDGIWDWDLITNEVFYSPRYKEQLGYEESELGNHFEVFRKLCHPEDYPRVMEEVQKHIERKLPFDVEFRMLTKGGAYKWISAKGQAVWNSQGKPVRMAGSHRDIDELKAAEKARNDYERKLLDSETMFRQLAENIREVFWIIDKRNNRFIYASPAFEEVFHRSCQALYQNAAVFLEQIVPTDQEAVKELLTLSDIPDSGKELEFRTRPPEGSSEAERWLWSRVFPVKDESGRTVRLCGIAHDITEKKEVERRVSEFYSTVSHELRTPLTSIRAALGLIEGGLTGDISEETLEYTTIAKDNCDRLIRLINDILDIRKLEAKKLDLKPVRVNAVDLTLHTIDTLKAYAEERSVKIALETDEAHECQADSDRLVQVLTNLISNAIKFSPKDGTVRIRLAQCQEQSGMLRFMVDDDGPGIKAEEVPELFGLFQQLSCLENESNTGSGLGLAISKALVENMAGKIGVESKPGRGTTFWFTLPQVLRNSAGQPHTTISDLNQAAQQDRQEPAKLLILEDSDSIAMLLKAFLTRKGFQTMRAASVAEAKELTANHRYDLIFADIHLPDGSGVDFINWLHGRQEDGATPVVVLSGAENPGLSINNRELVDYVRKPFDGEDLIKILGNRLYRGGTLRRFGEPDS
ncbi:MAG TPA: PAS domain S-box protein [Candidatus Obscuribacter sp.]|nr:PAS domain S-box protein [Candidatus Obscuribacter sp.]